MTWLGKILVFVNLVLSLAMAAWAFGLYTGRVDWSGKKGKTPDDPNTGQLARKQDAWRQAGDTLATAEGRFKANAPFLRRVEQQRPALAQFYARELEHLRSGASLKDPVRVVDVKDTRVQLQADGSPRMVPFKTRAGQPLGSVRYYEDELKAAHSALLEAIAQRDRLVQQDTKLTERLIGDKGLRQLVFNEEEVKQKRVLAEQQNLEPLLVNVQVESDLLLKRQKALKARIEELKAAGVAAGR